MGTALYDGAIGIVANPGEGKPAQIAKRMQCEVLRQQLTTESSTFRAHWQQLCDFILPRRARFYITDVNKGDRRNQNIVDSTATMAVRTCASGLMAGMTSPARPWFLLSTGDIELDEDHEVQTWLHEVRDRMLDVFRRSNLYNKLPILYGDIAVFGTGAFGIFEDDEDVVRCYDFPIGSYFIANDPKMQVRIFCRVFRLSVQQVVEKWGVIDPTTGQPDWAASAVSETVRSLWVSNSRAAWVDIVHLIQPNLSYDGQKIDAKYKRFEECYYELGSHNTPRVTSDRYGLLQHTGFDEFPILVGRWETNSEDVYATNCPGMTALGDIKQLQTARKRLAQAVEKMINPPLMGPSALRQAKTSILPGDLTYLDVREGMQGLKPIHEVNFGMAIGPLEAMCQEIARRIDECFFVNIFRMFYENQQKDAKTATEVTELKEEKLLALGPMLEQFNTDVGDPLIERTFNIMGRKGLIPPPPQKLQGVKLVVQYVSIMAQAQKQTALTALERFTSFVSQMVQAMPQSGVADIPDFDELIREYADATGVSPKVVRGAAEVLAMRQRRDQQAQAAQTAEAAPKLADAAQKLGSTPASGDNILAQLLGKQNARQTLSATASPPQPVVS